MQKSTVVGNPLTYENAYQKPSQDFLSISKFDKIRLVKIHLLLFLFFYGLVAMPFKQEGFKYFII